MWLQNGRAARGMSLEDVARVTKIQPRILERLETGRLDGLPAEVFVRGFVRNFARCVGLDEAEALRRYTACGPNAGTARATAVVDAMGDLAPTTRSRHPQVLDLASGSLDVIPVEPVLAEASEVFAVPPILETEPVERVEPDAAAVPAVEPPVVETVAVETVAVEAVAVETVAAEAAAVEEPVEAAPTKKKRSRRTSAAGTPPRRKRKAIATGTPSEPLPVVADAPTPKRRTRKARGTVAPPIDAAAEPAPVSASEAIDVAPIEIQPAEPIVEPPPVVEPPTESAVEPSSLDEIATATAPDSTPEQLLEGDPVPAGFAAPVESTRDPVDVFAELDTTADPATTRFERFDTDTFDEGTWTPKMPAVTSTTAVPWRRPSCVATPVLVAVIDDADPDAAERALEDRRVRESRRTFLPPILLDREDRSARQGGLTLAVIILLIAATLTLSYLMRRPSASGDGVTRSDTIETPTSTSTFV